MNVRERLEDIESETLHCKATLSANSKGRNIPETCSMRTCFQHDRDKIIHCKAFKRLGHKTQVFLSPKGDHYSTRLTHTLEVSQIARSISKALYINETLTEAIALGHDLGHTPFGHVGENVLKKVHSKDFNHVTHGVRVVTKIENNGMGLNLSHEVIDGIMKHSKGKGEIISDDEKLLAETLEGQVVRIADIIAYLNHDINDAVRGGILVEENIPKDLKKVFSVENRVDNMVSDVIESTYKVDLDRILLSKKMEKKITDMRSFMFSEVYNSAGENMGYDKIHKLINNLYNFFITNPKILEKEAKRSVSDIGVQQLSCDFIAGMTDRFAISMFEKYFIPTPWSVL